MAKPRDIVIDVGAQPSDQVAAPQPEPEPERGDSVAAAVDSIVERFTTPPFITPTARRSGIPAKTFEVEVNVAEIMPVEVELAVRTRACMKYIAASAANPMDEVMLDPYLASFGRGRLKEWARLDSWDAQRAEFQRAWADQVKLRLVGDIAQMRLRDVGLLDELLSQARGHLQITAAKTWEGTARVAADIIETRSELLRQIQQDAVLPADAANAKLSIASVEEVAVKHSLDQGQLRAAAHLLLDKQAGSADASASAAPAAIAATAAGQESPVVLPTKDS